MRSLRVIGCTVFGCIVFGCIAFVVLASTSGAQDKAKEPSSIEEDRRLLRTAFNWVQDPPAPKPGGIVLNFAGGEIFLEHSVDSGNGKGGNGKLDTRRVLHAAYELKQIGSKRVIQLKEKNDKLTDLTYTLKDDRLTIEQGECHLHGKTSLKGKWQRWLGDYSVSGGPYWPCPWAVVSDQLTSQPLAMFSAQKEAGGKAKCAYLLIFKLPRSFSTDGYVPTTTYGSNSEMVSHAHSFEVNGKTFEMEHKVKLDAKTEAPVSDSLTLGKNPVKEGEPRCYVVDMTGEITVYRPVKVDLPRVVLELPMGSSDEPKDWYRPAPQWVTPVMKDIGELKKKSAELRELLAPANDK